MLALLSCATVSELDRERAINRRAIGDSKLQRGQYELAIREYRASLDLNSTDPETHFGLSEAYRQKNLLEDAERELKAVLRYDRHHLEAKLNLGVVYLQAERWDDAIRINKELIDEPVFLRPGRALVNRGWAHYKSGRLEDAVRDFRSAVAENDSNFVAHLNLGIAFYDMGESVDAIAEFQRVVKIVQSVPNNPLGHVEAQARFRLAQAYVKVGNRTKALENLKVAMERGGKGEWGQKSKEYLAVLQ